MFTYSFIIYRAENCRGSQYVQHHSSTQAPPVVHEELKLAKNGGRNQIAWRGADEYQPNRGACVRTWV